MRKFAHLIYPYDKLKSHTPYRIGVELEQALIACGYECVIYAWDSTGKCFPKSDKDILIGHCHPSINTIFRNSIGGKWDKRILIQPFNGDRAQHAYLGRVIHKVDWFIGICGKYWEPAIASSGLNCQDRFTQVDLAVARAEFPALKNNSIGEHFVYIGNAGWTKNIGLLRQLQQTMPNMNLAIAGCNTNFGQQLGYVNLQCENVRDKLSYYRFLICPSKYDANPTVVLEAMSLGLIPIVSKYCGYTSDDGPIVVPDNNFDTWKKEIAKCISMTEQEVFKKRHQNFALLEQKFNWRHFRTNVANQIKLVQKEQALYERADLSLIIDRLRNQRLRYKIHNACLKYVGPR